MGRKLHCGGRRTTKPDQRTERQRSFAHHTSPLLRPIPLSSSRTHKLSPLPSHLHAVHRLEVIEADARRLKLSVHRIDLTSEQRAPPLMHCPNIEEGIDPSSRPPHARLHAPCQAASRCLSVRQKLPDCGQNQRLECTPWPVGAQGGR